MSTDRRYNAPENDLWEARARPPLGSWQIRSYRLSVVAAQRWTVRHMRRKAEAKHRRLSELSDPTWSGGVYGTHCDDRRASCFYAQDQLQAGYYGIPTTVVPQLPPPGSIGANVIQQRLRAHTPPRRRPHMDKSQYHPPSCNLAVSIADDLNLPLFMGNHRRPSWLGSLFGIQTSRLTLASMLYPTIIVCAIMIIHHSTAFSPRLGPCIVDIFLLLWSTLGS
ncbi:hypothetical protein JB92DRAFT_3121284 [Gautieria morchelliformis]|nr:hypothetical protein JB92DRAFT_3121284 [Gautieria morchelliformis]